MKITKKIVKELIKEWVVALRSGKFRKDKGQLCRIKNRRKCYCALGVLCELAARKGLVSVTKDGSFVCYDNCAGLLPHSLGNFIDDVSIAVLNDDKDKSFKQIADYIEAEYL